MNLTKGQEEALTAIRSLSACYPDGGGVAVIAGFAGTGKTTLISVLDEEYEGLFVLTPTGKAALRVKEATGCEAMTIHRWLYKAIEDPKTNDVSFVRKEIGELRYPASGVLIIDEASMVQFQVFQDLYSYAKALGLNLVFIGDNFQLPPVDTENKNFSVFAPEFPASYRVQLTEILRQALDSPIIRVSMSIRESRDYIYDLQSLPQVSEVHLNEEMKGVLNSGGVVICHRNVTRHGINNTYRKFVNLPDQPTVHEPLLVLQNNYIADVYNGEVVEIVTEPRCINVAPMAVVDRFKNASMYMDFLKFEISTSDGVKGIVVADREISGANGEVRSYAINRAGKALIRTYNEDPTALSVVHANWGYCLTAHKAQGSQFPIVLGVMEPSARLHTVDGRRWAYTLLTRAIKEVKLCWT